MTQMEELLPISLSRKWDGHPGGRGGVGSLLIGCPPIRSRGQGVGLRVTTRRKAGSSSGTPGPKSVLTSSYLLN